MTIRFINDELAFMLRGAGCQHPSRVVAQDWAFMIRWSPSMKRILSDRRLGDQHDF